MVEMRTQVTMMEVKVVRLLVEKGAKVDAENNDGKTPIQMSPTGGWAFRDRTVT